MSARDDSILNNMALVGFVVNRLSVDRYHTLSLEREDAMGYGIEGLIQAVDAFDPSRGTSFASFAVRRIRGAILDAIRRQDPLPRSLRRSARELERAAQELASQLGRWPTRKELAMRLGTTAQSVYETQTHAASRFVSLDHVLQERSWEGGNQRWDPADDDDRGNPVAATERLAALGQLKEAVGHLNERDRAILHLRYTESRPFHEVGTILGLSESRVCQIHKRIISRLRLQLAEALEEAA